MIKTNRLILRPMDINDLNDIYEYSKSPTISQYMYFKRIDDINQMKEYISNCIEQYNKKDKDIHSLSIIYNSKVIGEIALLFFEEGTELFWIISEKYQNQGFAYEAAVAYIDYIKDNFNLSKISAHCDTRNVPSKKLMEKLGFKYLKEDDRIYPDDRSPAFEYSYELVLGE